MTYAGNSDYQFILSHFIVSFFFSFFRTRSQLVCSHSGLCGEENKLACFLPAPFAFRCAIPSNQCVCSLCEQCVVSSPLVGRDFSPTFFLSKLELENWDVKKRGNSTVFLPAYSGCFPPTAMPVASYALVCRRAHTHHACLCRAIRGDDMIN